MSTTTACGRRIKSLLEEKGLEVIIFPTIGVGGRTLEELVKKYPLKGVIELALNETGNELFGGVSTAGPKRLEAAGKKRVPKIITPGNVDFIGFLAPETMPAKYENRNLAFHNPQATAMQLNADEMKTVAEVIEEKLNQSKGRK